MTSSPQSLKPNRKADASAADASLARIVRNSAFNTVGTALIVPFNFIALFTLARRLGAESLGTYFSILAIAFVIHWIADAGTSTVLTRRVARKPQDLQQIVSEATGLLMLVCFVSLLLFLIITSSWMTVFAKSVSWWVLGAAAVANVSRHALDFAANVFRGLERFEFENLARVLQTGTFCLFVWFGVYPETGDVFAGFIAYAASNVLAAVLIWAILWGNWNCAGLRINAAVLRDWLRESMPLGFGDAIRQLLLQLDTLLLTAFRPAAVVGLFSVASRPLQPLQLVPRIVASVTFPMMSRTAHSDRESLSQAFANTTNLLWVFSVPISILVSVCARPLILATAGPGFLDAAAPLSLLIWATALVFVNAQLRFVLTALDQERQYWFLISRTLVFKIACGIVLIPVWGLSGACVGNLFGEFVLCIGGLRVLQKLNVHGPAWTQLMRVVPGAIGMSLVLIPFAYSHVHLTTLGLAGIASLVTYVGICFACGAWPRADVLRVWQVVRCWTGGPAATATRRR